MTSDMDNKIADVEAKRDVSFASALKRLVMDVCMWVGAVCLFVLFMVCIVFMYDHMTGHKNLIYRTSYSNGEGLYLQIKSAQEAEAEGAENSSQGSGGYLRRDALETRRPSKK